MGPLIHRQQDTAKTFDSARSEAGPTILSYLVPLIPSRARPRILIPCVSLVRTVNFKPKPRQQGFERDQCCPVTRRSHPTRAGRKDLGSDHPLLAKTVVWRQNMDQRVSIPDFVAGIEVEWRCSAGSTTQTLDANQDDEQDACGDSACGPRLSISWTLWP